jgi:hypothetical protein
VSLGLADGGAVVCGAVGGGVDSVTGFAGGVSDLEAYTWGGFWALRELYPSCKWIKARPGQ